MSEHRLLSFVLRIGDTSYQGTPLPASRHGWLLLGLGRSPARITVRGLD